MSDYGRHATKIAEHEHCRRIAGDDSTPPSFAEVIPPPARFDAEAHPSKRHAVLPCDASQLEAILAIKSGASLVLDGSPGTGKSQTIANVIAECLADGRTVLFVSEKVAALEVVQQRLDQRNLGDFALNWHSHKASKKEIVTELWRCLNLPCEECASRDGRRLQAVLPQTEIEYKEANAEHAKQLQTRRSAVVTNDNFVSFLHCKRKAFLLAAGTPGRPPDIEAVMIDLGHTYRRQALEAFLAPYREHDVLHDPPCLEVALKCLPQVIVNATASGDVLSSVIQAAELMKTTGPNGASVYAPVLFMLNETVSHADKLLLAFNALALSSVQGVLPPIGKIVHGNSYRVLKCKIEPLVGEVRKLVVQIQAAQAEGAAPRVTLNRHCNICQFRADCQRLAEEADDLSLLRGMSAQEVEKQRSRGVMTVTQFAYTYRPGSRGKRKTGKARKHDHALQAVAIRDKKVYVLDSPTVPRSRVALYLDMEGVPDRSFDYLIGLVAVVDDCTTTHCFWADDRTQEKEIWGACRRVINSFEDYTLYHYGQYEQRYLDRMRRLTDEEGAATIDRIRARSCNMLAAIYSHIYFPTRYNGLKDVATFLGATWAAANASGIQSLAWRLAWETTGDETLKQQLIRYNLEDCLALRRVTEFVLTVCEGAARQKDDIGPIIASATDLQSVGGSHFGKIKFFCPELDHINKCAYSDYQREKVYVRTSPAVRKSLRRKQRVKGKSPKVNQEMMLPSPEVCPKCGGMDLKLHYKKNARKVVTDLKFTASGVKRWCVCYRSRHSKCLQCGQTFAAEGYRSLGLSHFGSNLSKWVAYQHVALRQSGRDIALNLNDLFGYSFERGILSHIIPSIATQ